MRFKNGAVLLIYAVILLIKKLFFIMAEKSVVFVMLDVTCLFVLLVELVELTTKVWKKIKNFVLSSTEIIFTFIFVKKMQQSWQFSKIICSSLPVCQSLCPGQEQLFWIFASTQFIEVSEPLCCDSSEIY